MKKNFMALGLSAAMIAGAAAPAFADGHTYCTSIDDVVANHMDADGVNSEETVEYYDEIENANGSYDTAVYAVIGSVYKVTIPKVIVLKGQAASKGASTAKYYVDVDGDIAGDKKVTVTPDATFDMKQAGKADVAATVTQEITEFLAGNSTATLTAGQAKLGPDTDAAANKDSEAFGTVSAELTAGKWAGTFNFEIDLANL